MKHKRLTVITIILFLSFLSSSLYCQPDKRSYIKTISGRKLNKKKLDQYIISILDSLKIPGLSIAIINNAEMVYHRAFGVTNIETKEPVNDQTIFEAASLSKPPFAYLVMKMADKGFIDLDRPLFNYLPHPDIKDNDERYKIITARMVLSHSTGFPNWANGEKIAIKFTPGTDFSYSGEAYQYLAAVIAVINKTNWKAGLDSIFQKEVASPLDMQHSYYTPNEYAAAHKARGHVDGKVLEVSGPGKSFGAGYSLQTESTQYAKFIIAMIKGTGLKNVSLEDMLKEQNHFKEDNELLKLGQTGWCMGFAMRPTKYGMRYMHTGNNTGFQAYCCFNREKKYGLVFFMNADKASEFYSKIGKYIDDEF